LSYQHKTWYTYTLWQSLGMHLPNGQKVKGQGHMITKTATVTRLLVTAVVIVLLQPPWDCTSYDYLGF